jgi:tetratricopeptide (TPR) repeat protein
MSIILPVVKIASRLASTLLVCATLMAAPAAWATTPIESCFNLLGVQDYRRAQNSAEALVQKNPNDQLSQMCLGQALYAQGNYKPAQEAFKKVENLSLSKADLAAAYNWLSLAYDKLGQIDEALNHGQRSLLLTRELKNQKEEANVLNNLALFYQQRKDTGRAIEMYEAALPLVESEAAKVVIWANMGRLYFEQGDSAKASSLLQQALDAARRAGNPYQIATCQLFLGEFLFIQGDLLAAENHLTDALAAFRKLGAKDREEQVLRDLKLLQQIKANKQ